jgi:hypothetical protein
MSKPLLLATISLCLFSAEASAHGVRPYHRQLYHRVSQQQVYQGGPYAYQNPFHQSRLYQPQMSQPQIYQPQMYQLHAYQGRGARARVLMSGQVVPTSIEQPRIAPELSDSLITASPNFARGYHRSTFQRLAYQTPADQTRLSYRRYGRAWCGAYLSAYLGRNDRRLALAREWAREGSNAGGPGIGVVVVWPHHVGIITGQAPNGEWLVHSGNDGGAVRTRARSLRGAIAFRRV